MDLFLNWLQIIFQRMCYNSNLSNMKEKNSKSHETSICSNLSIAEFATYVVPISRTNCVPLLVAKLCN